MNNKLIKSLENFNTAGQNLLECWIDAPDDVQDVLNVEYPLNASFDDMYDINMWCNSVIKTLNSGVIDILSGAWVVVENDVGLLYIASTNTHFDSDVSAFDYVEMLSYKGNKRASTALEKVVESKKLYIKGVLVGLFVRTFDDSPENIDVIVKYVYGEINAHVDNISKRLVLKILLQYIEEKL